MSFHGRKQSGRNAHRKTYERKEKNPQSLFPAILTRFDITCMKKKKTRFCHVKRYELKHCSHVAKHREIKCEDFILQDSMTCVSLQ